MHTTDITIIGAGLAGLLTANLLQHMAHSPLSITLIEANTSPGGLAQSHPIDSAYPHTRTNMGPHALYLNGPLHRLLRTLRFLISRLPSKGQSPAESVELITCNGLPTLTLVMTPKKPRFATRSVVLFQSDGHMLTAINIINKSSKINHLI